MESAKHILVVDDEPTSRRLLAFTLEKAGYAVIEAEDGKQALELAAAESVDLILLDIRMPGLDGHEVCRVLKSLPTTESIPVIFVSGMSATNAMVAAFSAGGCDYVTKPFRPDEVLARVSVHLRLREAEQALLTKSEQTAKLARKLADVNVELAHMGRIDPMTKLLNRGAWSESAMLEHERCDRHGGTYGIVMIDVDYFKKFNDSKGHLAGDECLQRIAKSIGGACGQIDIVGRYGGEEFIILAPETDSKGILVLAERVRKVIWDEEIPHDASPVADRVTISVGVAVSGSGTVEDVIKEADDALYAGKESGRNQVCIGSGAAPLPKAPLRARSPEDVLDQGTSAGRCQASILLVDEDADARRLCKSCLEGEGYQVREALDAESAFSAATSYTPDVIVLDATLPGMDGLELTRQLKAHPRTRTTPIILLIARTDPEDNLAGRDVGADEYLCKPVRAMELAIRVRSMVRFVRTQEALLRSYESRGEHARVLSVLLDYCRTLATFDKLEDVLERTVAVVADLTGSRRVSIMMPDEDEQTLTISHAIGIDAEVAKRVRVPVGGGVAGKVFATRTALIINSEPELMGGNERYETEFFATYPLVSSPLDTADRVVGVLNLTERMKSGPFAPNELGYVELVSGIAAAAINDVLTREAHQQACDSIVVALAKLAEHRDDDTGRHLERVSRYCLMLAKGLREHDAFCDVIDDEFLNCLDRAVPLHDIGKVAIADNILLKPGRLSDAEMAVMKQHAAIGAETIRSVRARAPGAKFLDMAEEIALGHHEWFDGGGYPRGLRGEAIPLAARIAALADVYDALTTERPYKKAMSHAKAVTIIADSSGTQFDPIVVEIFLDHQHLFERLLREMGDHDVARPEPVAVHR